MSPTRMSRAGFTALELVVVLGLMSALAGVTASGVLGAQRKAKVNDSVSAIERSVAQASVLARGSYHDETDSKSSEYNYCVVISGDDERKGVWIERRSAGGTIEVVLEHSFGPQVYFFIDGELTTSLRRIYFDAGTGFTSDVGKGPGRRATLGIDEELVLATPDGQVAYQFSIYEVGLVRSVRLDR